MCNGCVHHWRQFYSFQAFPPHHRSSFFTGVKTYLTDSKVPLQQTPSPVWRTPILVWTEASAQSMARWLTNDIDCSGIPPNLTLPQLNEDGQRLFGSSLVMILQCSIQEVLNCSIQAVILVLPVCGFDVCNIVRLFRNDAALPESD